MKNLLDNVRIASPCHENWSAMTGDARTRHCQKCDHQVFNLSEMTEDDAIALLESRGQQRTCIRLYRRVDGTVITKDCPVGVRKARQRSYIRGAAAAAVALAAAACNRVDAGNQPSLPMMGTPSPVAHQAELEEMGDFCPPAEVPEVTAVTEPIPQVHPAIMGKICVVPPPPAPIQQPEPTSEQAQ